ncbi:lipoprotein [Nocardioides ginsengisoli]|uniref:Lipoprotein with Yx(FWY)xxD motif n=1 Tax=Nocardioides ginsengisoli TaxID=363868 RepID=A0ABW3W3A4_9ACTN
MNKRAVAVPMLAAAVLALGGCGTSSDKASSDHSPGSTGGSGPVLKLATKGKVGKVLVDSSGKTVYFYDLDKAGETTSACVGPCVPLWPSVSAPANPTLGPGVSGTLGTVKDANGGSQLTLNGHPLYTYSLDKDAEDAYGPGYDHIWWVVDARGAKVTTMGGSSGSTSSPGSPSPSSTGGGGGYNY